MPACVLKENKRTEASEERTRLADWFVNVKFSEVARSGPVEAAQDLNTKTFKRTLIHFNTDTQYAYFR